MEIIIAIIIIAFVVYLLARITADKKVESYEEKNKLIDESMKKSEEESLKEYKENVRSRMERRKLVMDVLYEIGCIPEVDDEDNICFKYQGTEFYINAHNGYVMISIWCPTVFSTNVDELNIVYEAINDTNINSFAKYVYFVDEEKAKIYVQTKSQILFVAAISELEKYLIMVLDEVFMSYNELFKKNIERLRIEHSIGLN